MVFTGKHLIKPSPSHLGDEHKCKGQAYERRWSLLTKNQIEYLKMQEQRRSNQANEELTARRDSNTYLLGTQQLEETRRSNMVREAQQSQTIEENRRHNIAQEEAQLRNIAESKRSHRASELIEGGKLSEQVRANRANEYLKRGAQDEQRRSNVANERIKSETNQINAYLGLQNVGIAASRANEEMRHNKAQEQITSQYNLGNLYLGLSTLGETIRSNQVREVETERSNVARETEAERSNKAREGETKRHNISEESIAYDKNAEAKRHNQRTEGQEDRRQDEIERSNKKQESIKVADTVQRYLSLGNDFIHDRATEGIALGNTLLRGVETLFGRGSLTNELEKYIYLGGGLNG